MCEGCVWKDRWQQAMRDYEEQYERAETAEGFLRQLGYVVGYEDD